MALAKWRSGIYPFGGGTIAGVKLHRVCSLFFFFAIYTEMGEVIGIPLRMLMEK